MLALLLLLSGAELPSAEPPVVVMREARDLLKAREFARLTKLVQAQESAAEKDPGQADRLDWTLNAFRLEDAAIPGLLDEWVKQAPQSWASASTTFVAGSLT